MQRSIIIAAAALAAVATPAAAHAAHDLGPTVRLTEVSADPRDGDDTIELRGLRDFTHLQLRARAARVDIHGLGLRLHDGQIRWMDVRARLEPGEQRTIELPAFARRAEALVVDYGDPATRRRDRTPARLELYGAVADGRFDDRFDGRFDDRFDDRFDGRFDDRHDGRLGREGDGRRDRWERGAYDERSGRFERRARWR